MINLEFNNHIRIKIFSIEFLQRIFNMNIWDEKSNFIFNDKFNIYLYNENIWDINVLKIDMKLGIEIIINVKWRIFDEELENVIINKFDK